MGTERSNPDGPWRRELDVFPTGTTVLRSIDAPPAEKPADTSTLHFSDQMHRTGTAVRDAVQHAREFHARPGHRPGHVAPSTASVRRGGGTDIVRPVLVDPLRACELAISGTLFELPLDHLDVEHPGHVPSLTWRVVLTTGRRRRHEATLHLLASPSMVVTVIELVPSCRVRRRRRRFVAEGIVAVEELAHRLERVCTAPADSW